MTVIDQTTGKNHFITKKRGHIGEVNVVGQWLPTDEDEQTIDDDMAEELWESHEQMTGTMPEQRQMGIDEAEKVDLRFTEAYPIAGTTMTDKKCVFSAKPATHMVMTDNGHFFICEEEWNKRSPDWNQMSKNPNMQKMGSAMKAGMMQVGDFINENEKDIRKAAAQGLRTGADFIDPHQNPASMVLDGMDRDEMPASDFALPSERKFPINTKEQAMHALTFAEWPNNKHNAVAVRRAVFERYPELQDKFNDGKYQRAHYRRNGEEDETTTMTIPQWAAQSGIFSADDLTEEMGAGYFDLEDWESNEAIFVDDSHGMRVIVKPPKGFVIGDVNDAQDALLIYAEDAPFRNPEASGRKAGDGASSRYQPWIGTKVHDDGTRNTIVTDQGYDDLQDAIEVAEYMDEHWTGNDGPYGAVVYDHMTDQEAWPPIRNPYPEKLLDDNFGDDYFKQATKEGMPEDYYDDEMVTTMIFEGFIKPDAAALTKDWEYDEPISEADAIDLLNDYFREAMPPCGSRQTNEEYRMECLEWAKDLFSKYTNYQVEDLILDEAYDKGEWDKAFTSHGIAWKLDTEISSQPNARRSDLHGVG